MKLTGEPSEWTVTQTILGRILGVSRQRIGQLIEEDVVQRDDESANVYLIESLRNYYQSKRTYNDGSGKSLNYWTEHALHERAKRELAELKLSKARGKLYEAAEVERVLIELVTNFRSKVMGLPAKVSWQLQNRSASTIDEILTSELEELLEELSAGVEAAQFAAEDLE